MFWYLLFAHFAADYTLQPGWMVQNKTRIPILVLHVFIHFLLYAIVVLTVSWTLLLDIWNYLLLLALLHFVIDLIKNWLSQLKPAWVAGPYLIDQAAHFVTIFIVAQMVQPHLDRLLISIDSAWVVYASAYLIVTHVWYISERILSHQDEHYRQEVITHTWSRMIARAVLLSLMMLVWRGLGGASAQAMILRQFLAAVAMTQISRERIAWFSVRTVITDITAAAVGLAYIIVGTS